DATSVKAISLFKQISKSVQAIAASVAGTLTVATHAVTQSGTWNVTVNTALAAGANVIGGITAAASSFADGALVAIGLKTDAKSTATDATSVSAMSVWKQISASVQALATALSSLTNTGDALDVNIKSGSVAAKQDYQDFAASTASTAVKGQAGASGAAGDWIDFIEVFPETTAAGAVTLQDGTNTAVTVWAGGGTTALTSLIPFTIPVRANSHNGAWKVTTST